MFVYKLNFNCMSVDYFEDGGGNTMNPKKQKETLTHQF